MSLLVPDMLAPDTGMERLHHSAVRDQAKQQRLT